MKNFFDFVRRYPRILLLIFGPVIGLSFAYFGSKLLFIFVMYIISNKISLFYPLACIALLGGIGFGYLYYRDVTQDEHDALIDKLKGQDENYY